MADEMERTDRWRPIIGGISCGHHRITAGTLGAFLWLDGTIFIASNSHVLSDSGQGHLGDAILQPGPWDNGDEEEDVVATLSFFEPYKINGMNTIDFALAEPVVSVRDRILGFEPQADIVGVEVFAVDAQLGMTAVRSGRTTGLTVGEVTSVDAVARISGFPQGELMFEDLIVVEGAEPLCKGGDSGSAILTPEGGFLGLLFAGPAEEPYNMYLGCKIGNMLKAIEGNPAFRPGTYTLPRARWVVPMIGVGGIIAMGGFYFGWREK